MFCARSHPFDWLCRRAGHPYHHVGIVLRDGGELVVAEMSLGGTRMRSLDEVDETYERLAIGRPKMCGSCRSAVLSSFRSLMATGLEFARLDSALAGTVALLETRGVAIRSVLPIGDPGSRFMCSSLILRAFDAADCCHPHLALEIDSRWALPGDIWFAPAIERIVVR